MSEEIPLIDFGRFMNGNIEERQIISKELGDACRDIGFCYLTNCGISEEIISNVYKQSKRFFDQRIEEKMSLYIGSCPYGNNRGYTPFFEETLSPAGDLKEGFDIALELPSNDQDRIDKGAQLYGPNFWPENLPGFRECLYNDYYLKMVQLGEKVFESFSLYLNYPLNYFHSMCLKGMITMRILHYPPQNLIENKEQLGCGAHTDYECFTLVNQSNHSALQIQKKNGEWRNIIPIKNTFVLNIGDMMQRWTNDLFKSTIHRVINQTGQRRYSIPMFFGPHFSTEIRSLIPNEKDKYLPIIAGDYLIERFNQTYQYRSSNSSSSSILSTTIDVTEK